MKSIENLEWRYAVKKFDDQKILEKQKINIIKQAFNLTATSYGLQPIKLLIIKNKSIQRFSREYHPTITDIKINQI